MKKLFAVLAAILVLCFCSCSKSKTDGAPKPENSGLELWLTDCVPEDFADTHMEIPGWFGAREFYAKGCEGTKTEDGFVTDPEVYTKYLVGGYPDESDDHSFIINIETNDPKISIYGFKFGMTKEQFVGIFSQNGFTEVKEDSEFITRMKCGKYDAILCADYLCMRVETTNKKDIVY